MGGDHGPAVVVPACVRALECHPDLSLILVGDQEIVRAALAAAGTVESERLRTRHASQRVEMGDLPSFALRSKKDSSMRVAIDLVKSGEAQASVSAGNTGALMATAKFVLKTLPGIDRPAICGRMPSMANHTHVLDLGANVDSSSEELFQFAVMGSVLASAMENKERPSIALLNVGEEEIKGNDRVKQTSALLAASPLNYVGFAEGDDLFKGRIDVIVCDGFVGNIALKAAEGAAKMLGQFAKEEFGRSLWTRLGAMLSMPALKALRRRADPRCYNGASLLGLRGIVVKSHGSADRVSFLRAIEVAYIEAEKKVPALIAGKLEEFLMERRPA